MLPLKLHHRQGLHADDKECHHGCESSGHLLRRGSETCQKHPGNGARGASVLALLNGATWLFQLVGLVLQLPLLQLAIWW
eukprot:symbB.v1.2.011398.t1/scaffold764.1/size165801/4